MTDDWRRSIEKRLQSLELASAVDEVHRLNVDKRLLGGVVGHVPTKDTNGIAGTCGKSEIQFS